MEKWGIRLAKAIGWAWLFVTLFGGLVSLRHGDPQYSAWIAASCWPGVLLLIATYLFQRWRRKTA